MEDLREEGLAESAPQKNLPTAIRLIVTDKQHIRYRWQVCDPFLDAVLKREVLTVSLTDGAIEVSVQSLAQYINDAEKQRSLAEQRSAASKASCAPTQEECCASSDPSAASPQPPEHHRAPPPSTSMSTSSSFVCDSAASSSLPLPPAFCDAGLAAGDPGSLRSALVESVLADGAFFFALARELYEVSRDPFRGRGRAGDVYTLQEHCPGFCLCCAVFKDVYNRMVRPVADKLPDFAKMTVDDLLRFRKAARDTFKLRPDEPNMTGPSESNLDSDWVNENVKKDQYFFHERARWDPRKQRGVRPSLTDITLSYIPSRKRSGGGGGGGPAAAAANAAQQQLDDAEGTGKVNEVPTYYLTELLQNPSWEPEDARTQCRQCGNYFKSVAWPFGVRAHHCRSCGHRLCAACIAYRAHRSFAKLSKPGSSVEEPDERLVCGACYEAYLNLERHRYLGALFAFGGLDFANLSLCRTVCRQWRQAVELCISEYRLLLHQCEPDLKSVLTPVGVLLQNSVHLIASTAPPPAADRPKLDRATTTTATTAAAASKAGEQEKSSPLLVSFHPEPALLLLKFIEAKAQWEHPSTKQLLELLAVCAPRHFGGSCFLGGGLPPPARKRSAGTRGGGATATATATTAAARPFSHWHFYCTACCSKMLPTFFAVKAAELISAAPASCRCAHETAVRLAQNLLSPRVVLPRRTVLGGGAAPHRPPTPGVRGRPSLNASEAPVHTADVANAESVTMWLLDLLFRDAAERDGGKRRHQLFLEAALPPLAAASVPLTILMLCSLQSGYPSRGYDEELLGLWRTRIWEEVGVVSPATPSLSQEAASAPPSSMGAGEQSDVRATLEATMEFFHKLDSFCTQSTAEVRSVMLRRWLKEYCSHSVNGKAPLTAADPHGARPPCSPCATAADLTDAGAGTAPAAASSSLPSCTAPGSVSAEFVDLPQPIFNPFRPEVLLKSIRVSNIRVEETSSTRPVWLTFSTYSAADRLAAKNMRARKGAAKLKEHHHRHHHATMTPHHADASAAAAATTTTRHSAMPHERLYEFLYKRENAERDQLMCISGRLLQLFLRDEIDDAQLTNYSVLPLSCDSALIEKADGYVLSKLPGTSSSADIITFLNTLGDEAKRNFLASAKLFLLMNYIFSIGDRHQGNVMVSFQGAILHIDFGFIFSEKTLVEKIAGTTMRVDNQFLAAVAMCRRSLREKGVEAQQQQQQQQQHEHAHERLSTETGALVAVTAGAGGAPAAAGVGADAVVPSSSLAAVRRPIPASVEYDEFFREAADWFLALRPHAMEFYELWLYAAGRRTFAFTPRDLAVAINCLFDRSTSRESSRETFVATMKQSINVCRLKDVTHSSVQAIKSYSGQVSKKVADGSYEVVRSLGSLWDSWKKT